MLKNRRYMKRPGNSIRMKRPGVSFSYVMAGIIAITIVVASAIVATSAFPSSASTSKIQNQSTTSLTEATSTSTSSESVGNCSRAFSSSIIQGTKSNSSWVVFDTNSTAYVCVEILNPGNEGNATWIGPSTIQMINHDAFVNPVNLTVSVEAARIQLSPGSVGWYVFKIVPEPGTHAIYNVGLPDRCWNPFFILAVGYSVADLRSTMLSVPSEIGSCPLGFGKSTVQGVTNLIPVYSQ